MGVQEDAHLRASRDRSRTERASCVGLLVAIPLSMLRWILSLTGAALLTVTSTAVAQTTEPDASSHDDWLTRWMRTVDEARVSQPHYPAPIVTTHVLLVEQLRYDMSRQQDPNGTGTANLGASRGLEIILPPRLEIAISPPPYLTHQSSVPDGFGDTSFQVKYRVSSAPEEKGDYFVGVFFAGTVPTGTAPNGADHAVFLPTLAVAKGIGPVDVQTTLAAGLPASGTELLGRTLVSNTAVDLRIRHGLADDRAECTHWSGGTSTEKRGVRDARYRRRRFPSWTATHRPGCRRADRGVAVSPVRRRWIASMRLPF